MVALICLPYLIILSMQLNTFTMLYSHHLYPLRTFFIISNRKPVISLNNNFSFSLSIALILLYIFLFTHSR